MNKMHTILAQRYASAYLKVFSRNLTRQDIFSFEAVSLFFKQKKQACFLMDVSLLSAEAKDKALQDIISFYKLPNSCMNLFSVVIKEKRSLLLGAIFDQIAQLYKKQLEIITMLVESSLEMSDQQKIEIALFLKQQLQAIVICTFKINSALIAGLRISNQNYVWERSVQAQLKALENSGKGLTI